MENSNNQVFMEKLKEIEPELYKIWEFMKMTSNLFSYGEMEIKVVIHCANFRDKYMTLEGSQEDKKVKESVNLNLTNGGKSNNI